MCDFVGGQVIVTRPRGDGPAARVALAALGAALLPTAAARAGLSASATISDQQVGPNSYKYSLTLTNSATSTVSAASFWFGWFPG